MDPESTASPILIATKYNDKIQKKKKINTHEENIEYNHFSVPKDSLDGIQVKLHQKLVMRLEEYAAADLLRHLYYIRIIIHINQEN